MVTNKQIGSIKIARLRLDAEIPVRASDGAIGYDVFASRVLDRNTKKVLGELPVTIKPGEAVLIGIGISFALPWGFEVQVRPRSGLASKHDIELSNSPGTVDPDFRGEVGCLLRNRGSHPFTIERNMRIAQLVFSRVEIPKFVLVKDISDLPPTQRGTGGFGSTGLYGLGFGTEQHDRAVTRIDQYFMNIVLETADLSNCVRGCPRGQNGQYQRDERGRLKGQTRRYGCVIARDLHIISSGYNAQHIGSELCAEVGCLRDELKIPSGEQIEVCRALHAEQMAINSAAEEGVSVKGAIMYTNAEPCLFCARQIAGLDLNSLVVLEGGYSSAKGLEIVQKAGIPICRVCL